jgi:FtsP/CotA-like multicopper oxidase with cupredoxin domain
MRKPNTTLSSKSCQDLDKISRRQLLQSVSASAALAGAGLSGALWPESVAAQDETLNTLNVMMANVDSDEFKLRTYNGKSPGPTLRVNPGRDLDVLVNNGLAAETEEEFCPSDHNTFHGANTTNFHTHGLHVSPFKSSNGRFDADNVFLKIVPKDQRVPAMCDTDNLRRERAAFKFELPNDHPSGTFWYHAHNHGSTSQQVSNGLVGPLIVNDPPNYMPSYIANAPEDVFMIQLRDLIADKEDPRASRGDGKLTIVRALPEGGGQKDPVIVMRPGEVRRWRFINAATSADAFVNLSAPGLDVYQIAFDGLTLDRRFKVDPKNDSDPWNNPAALAPGNRTDFMIHIPKTAQEGELSLVANRVRANVLHDMPLALAASEPVRLRVIIAGTPVDNEWSEDDALPGSGHAPIDRTGAIKRKVEFGFVPGGLGIDGEKFTGKVKAPKMKLNTKGEWYVKNSTTFTHPFHIHVNPFFVTHINGVNLADLPHTDPRRHLMRWQDTIALPPRVEEDDTDGEIRFLTRYETFTGKFVIHCHILGHEDTGMMQAVEVES